MGRESPRCAGVPEVLEKHFGQYTKGIYAVGGDICCCPSPFIHSLMSGPKNDANSRTQSFIF